MQDPHGEDKGQQVQIISGEVSFQCRIFFFFTLRTIIHWNNLPTDMVDSPSLEAFRT